MKLSLSNPRIVLMIGDDGVVVAPFEIADTTPFFAPAGNRHIVSDIIDFIDQHPYASVTLLADTMAQDYRSDTLPRLTFFDRAKLISRRLKQNFPAARLTASVRYKKSHDRILMIGLHESNPVFAWADRLRGRLPDIALLPVEGARLAAKLMPEAATGWAMMISRQKSGGFRQIVTFRNDLVFTRLTPLPPDASDDGADVIARDIKASLDYLSRHGLRDASSLSALLVMPGDIHLDPALTKMPLKSVRSLSPFAAAKKLGLPFAPSDGDSDGDLLFAAYFLAQPRAALSLMLPEARQDRLTQTIRQWGLRAAGMMLFIVATITFWRAGDLAATLYQTQKEFVRLEEMRRTLAQAQANAAPVTEPLGRMRQALERRRIYEQPTPMPWQILNELGSGLNDDAKIIRLEWKKENDNEPDTLNVGLRMLSATIPPDRAEIAAAFTRAAENIERAAPDYAVSIIKPPYPSLPQESVTAATGISDDPVGEIALRRKAND